MMTDEYARARATEYVLQRYHLSTLQEAQDRLTPDQFAGLQREIGGVQDQILAQMRPQPPAAQSARPSQRGIVTPFGPILPVTGLLLVAIWIVFGVETLQPGGLDNTTALDRLGAVAYSALDAGEAWRLLAACFLHVDLMHIISNSIALIWLGSMAERFYGPLRYLGIYLATGVGGNLIAVPLMPHDTIAAGASGAIFGLMGAVLVGSWRNRSVIGPAAGRQIASSLTGVIVLNLAISFLPGIGWYAHLGGAITGAILALLIPFNSRRYAATYARMADVLSVVLIVVSLAPALTWIGNHQPL